MTDTPTISDNAGATLTKALRAHLVVTVLLLVGALAFGDRPMWVGVLAGCAIGAANLRGLVWITQRLTSDHGPSRMAAHALLLTKMMLTCGAIGLTLFVLRPSALALTLGWTSSLVCLVVASQIRRPAPPASIGGVHVL